MFRAGQNNNMMRHPVCYALAALLLILSIGASGPALAQDDILSAPLKVLTDNNFRKKATAIEQIAASGDERAADILKVMLDGDLYYVKKTDEVVYRKKVGKEYEATSVLTGEVLGSFGSRDLKRVGINNRLRGLLKAKISGLELRHADPKRRTLAAKRLFATDDADVIPELDAAIAAETDSGVRTAFRQARASILALTADGADRIAAIEDLADSVSPESKSLLLKIIQQNEGKDGTADLVAAAKASLDSIESKLELYSLAETVFFGLSLGSVLLLAAVGLAITFGVMGVINMAHGEMMMLGAYTTFVVQQAMPDHIGWSLPVAIPAAFVVTALVGMAIERGVIRHLYGRPLETLLATFGISLVLQQAVRTIFSPLNRSVATPDWMSGSLVITDALSLTYNRLYIIVFALLVLAALMALLRFTSFGVEVRAVTQNRPMAAAMGIRTGWIDSLTFGLGSGIAGMAGVALSQITNVGPNLGQAYIVDCFMVVVFGGVGNLWGTLTGAMLLGLANKFLEPVSGAVLAKIFVLVFIILFIQKRPRGLFALKGRAVEA